MEKDAGDGPFKETHKIIPYIFSFHVGIRTKVALRLQLSNRFCIRLNILLARYLNSGSFMTVER